MRKYLIVIELAENNYSAFSPDVPGCVATGNSIDETLSNMKSALQFHLEGLDAIPEPKGLRFHLEAGEFNQDEITEEYVIVQI